MPFITGPLFFDDVSKVLYDSQSDQPLGQAILAAGSPNLTLNDTPGSAGTTATPFPLVLTLPGGKLGPNSRIRVTSTFQFVGANSKSVLQRVGQATTATFATATPIAGQAGLTTQVSAIYVTQGWNRNSLASQRWTPVNNSSFGAGLNAWVSTTLDTGLDINLWHGVQFTLLSGGDSATWLDYTIEILP